MNKHIGHYVDLRTQAKGNKEPSAQKNKRAETKKDILKIELNLDFSFH